MPLGSLPELLDLAEALPSSLVNRPCRMAAHAKPVAVRILHVHSRTPQGMFVGGWRMIAPPFLYSTWSASTSSVKIDIHTPACPCPPSLRKISTFPRATLPNDGGVPQSHFLVKPSLLT